MRALLFALGLAGLGLTVSAGTSRMMTVADHNHTAYVSSVELEKAAAIAIKLLPGTDTIAACSEDRCARLKDFLREGDVISVNVAEIAKAMGLTATFSDDRRQVQFEAATPTYPNTSVTGVGDLVPNLRLVTLSGSPVSLADFRGKRLLIQSWGSW
jgi:hypothetical protein